MKHIRGIGCTYDQHQIALGTHGVTSKEALAIAKLEAQMAEQYPHLIIQQVERDEGIKLFPAMHKHLEPQGYAAMCRVVGDIDYVWVYSVGATVATHRTHDKARVVDLYSRSTGADGELERFREELARLGIGGGK